MTNHRSKIPIPANKGSVRIVITEYTVIYTIYPYISLVVSPACGPTMVLIFCFLSIGVEFSFSGAVSPVFFLKNLNICSFLIFSFFCLLALFSTLFSCELLLIFLFLLDLLAYAVYTVLSYANCRGLIDLNGGRRRLHLYVIFISVSLEISVIFLRFGCYLLYFCIASSIFPRTVSLTAS